MFLLNLKMNNKNVDSQQNRCWECRKLVLTYSIFNLQRLDRLYRFEKLTRTSFSFALQIFPNAKLLIKLLCWVVIGTILDAVTRFNILIFFNVLVLLNLWRSLAWLSVWGYETSFTWLGGTLHNFWLSLWHFGPRIAKLKLIWFMSEVIRSHRILNLGLISLIGNSTHTAMNV